MSWLPKKSVVVPHDFSEQSDEALRTARELVEDLTQLHVIHVLPIVTVGEPGMIWETVDNESRVRHAEIALQDILDSTPFQKIGLHVRLGEPAREIVTFAEHVKAELIVLPSHGRTGLSRLLIGSVAERVVRMAHCPVLILRGLSHKDG